MTKIWREHVPKDPQNPDDDDDDVRYFYWLFLLYCFVLFCFIILVFPLSNQFGFRMMTMMEHKTMKVMIVLLKRKIRGLPKSTLYVTNFSMCHLYLLIYYVYYTIYFNSYTTIGRIKIGAICRESTRRVDRGERAWTTPILVSSSLSCSS